MTETPTLAPSVPSSNTHLMQEELRAILDELSALASATTVRAHHVQITALWHKTNHLLAQIT